MAPHRMSWLTGEQGAMLHRLRGKTDALHACCRVGVHLPSVEVRFEGLEVSGQCYAAGRELPSIWNAYRNWFEVGQATSHSK